MNVVSNESNIEPLKKTISSLKSGEILLSSGWIRSNKLREILDIKTQEKILKGKISLKVLLRVGELKDIEITDSGVFSFIRYLQDSDSSDVQWRYSSHHHAKMFIVGDEFGMLGSFNLTGGGFGTESYPGNNPEAGVITRENSQVEDMKGQFFHMWDSAAELNTRINGFVANKSDNSRFYMIGIGSLPAGQFVQVDSDMEGVSILGKIEKSYRYHREYYQVEENPLIDQELLNLFTNKNDQQNLLNGVATSGNKPEYQLNISEVKILMSVEEREERFLFNPVNVPPAVASPVFKADPDLLMKLFNPETSEYAVLEENQDVYISFKDRELLTKHFAVLGSTGSGKSYFVKKFINKRLLNLIENEDLRVVIVDTHGEYTKEETGFDFTNITADKSEALSAIPVSCIDDIKEYFGSPSSIDKKLLEKAFLDEDKFLEVLKSKVDENREEIDWDSVLTDLEIKADSLEEKAKKGDHPIAFKVKSYLNEKGDLDSIEDQTVKKILLDKLRDKIIKELKGVFKLAENDNSYLKSIISAFESGNYRIKTLNLIEKVSNPGIYRLDLTAVDEAHIRQNIVGDLMQEVFNRAKSENKSGKSFKTLFIVDEAQNYAPEKAGNSISSNRWMKVIASEGRKFSVGLLVMTQRPAYLSKDVLSQCSSQAIFRLINQGDINQVAGTVEGISEYDLLQLPQFTAGQALFTGVGMEMPVRVRVLE